MVVTVSYPDTVTARYVTRQVSAWDVVPATFYTNLPGGLELCGFLLLMTYDALCSGMPEKLCCVTRGYP